MKLKFDWNSPGHTYLLGLLLGIVAGQLAMIAFG